MGYVQLALMNNFIKKKKLKAKTRRIGINRCDKSNLREYLDVGGRKENFCKRVAVRSSISEEEI